MFVVVYVTARLGSVCGGARGFLQAVCWDHLISVLCVGLPPSAHAEGLGRPVRTTARFARSSVARSGISEKFARSIVPGSFLSWPSDLWPLTVWHSWLLTFQFFEKSLRIQKKLAIRKTPEFENIHEHKNVQEFANSSWIWKKFTNMKNNSWIEGKFANLKIKSSWIWKRS